MKTNTRFILVCLLTCACSIPAYADRAAQGFFGGAAGGALLGGAFGGGKGAAAGAVAGGAFGLAAGAHAERRAYAVDNYNYQYDTLVSNYEILLDEYDRLREELLDQGLRAKRMSRNDRNNYLNYSYDDLLAAYDDLDALNGDLEQQLNDEYR